MLLQLAGEMERLSSAIERRGGQVPSRAIPYVYGFFDLADALLLQEVNSTTGSDRQCGGWVVNPSTEDE